MEKYANLNMRMIANGDKNRFEMNTKNQQSCELTLEELSDLFARAVRRYKRVTVIGQPEIARIK